MVLPGIVRESLSLCAVRGHLSVLSVDSWWSHPGNEMFCRLRTMVLLVFLKVLLHSWKKMDGGIIEGWLNTQCLVVEHVSTVNSKVQPRDLHPATFVGQATMPECVLVMHPLPLGLVLLSTLPQQPPGVVDSCRLGCVPFAVFPKACRLTLLLVDRTA